MSFITLTRLFNPETDDAKTDRSMRINMSNVSTYREGDRRSGHPFFGTMIEWYTTHVKATQLIVEESADTIDSMINNTEFITLKMINKTLINIDEPQSKIRVNINNIDAYRQLDGCDKNNGSRIDWEKGYNVNRYAEVIETVNQIDKMIMLKKVTI